MSKPRKSNPYRALRPIAAILFVVLAVLCALTFLLPKEDAPEQTQPDSTVSTTEAPTEGTKDTQPTTEAPTEAAITKTGSATILATGDMLMHKPCIRGGETGDGYDFTPYFSNIKPYIESATFAVCNLETTLAGLDNGYEYSGYPSFNCPDDLVDSLKSTGFDLLLTANNHCYDTRSVGFLRTQKVIAQAGLLSTGTVSDAETPNYQVVELDGIRIGMICYTYEDDSDPNVVAPNGITMTDSDKYLINSFNVNELETFYEEMSTNIAAMEDAGAEAIVLYIHWGVEYQTSENATQQAIAQKMCDLGVDVIVGGHPHVIQPMDLLTSTADPDHKTVCLYSTGNALSNQRRDLMTLNTGHTEDGILFQFTFVKYSDGTVRVEDVELIPTWIDLRTDSDTGNKVYDILPLDKTLTDWKTSFSLSDSTLAKANESYQRTMDIVGEGLNKVQSYLATLPEIQ